MRRTPRTSQTHLCVGISLWITLVFTSTALRVANAQSPAENPSAPAPPAAGVLEAIPAKTDAEPPPSQQTPEPAPRPGLEPILAEAPVQAGSSTPGAAPSSGKISYSSCTVEGSQVAITFDDGPHATNTPRLLEILKQKGVRATFFVVGQNAVEYPDILKRITAEGHELANHSFSHPLLVSLSETALREQLEKTHQAVLKATGVSMKLMRPPYGALSNPQRAWVHSHFGYRVILWDVDPLDWKVRDAAKVEQAIVSRAHAGSIILAHDIHKTTVDAVSSTLDQLLQKGLKFVTVSELLALDKPSKTSTAGADAENGPVRSGTKSKNEKTSVATPARVSLKSGGGMARASGVEKSAAEKNTDRHPEKKGERTAEKEKAPDKTAAPTASTGGKKFSQLSAEEVRKKWLEGLKR
jgi:peptidoglycan/xylan/chitin deacetylase (PgdA/CDA1 family)